MGMTENEVDPHSLLKIKFHAWKQLVPGISVFQVNSFGEPIN